MRDQSFCRLIKTSTELVTSGFPARGLAAAGLVATALFAWGCGPSYPNCDEDQQCRDGEYCVNGLCQQCRETADCPSGQQCDSGACEPIPGYCDEDSDCPSGQECIENRCSVPETAAAPPSPPSSPPPVQCQLQSVYFSFDSDDLDSTARDALQSNASCIRERDMSAVHLTGHADPRGTEEYNLALGDRRARSVARFLNSLGVRSSVSSSSMGEEMATGASDSGWTRDRRVEFMQR
ncbi:MAG: OmpA family protein [Myxococcota bacterium]